MPVGDVAAAAAWRAANIRPRAKPAGRSRVQTQVPAAPAGSTAALLLEEKLRRERAAASLAEIELGVAEGRVLPRAEVAAALAARDALVRTRLRAIVPTRVLPVLKGRLAPALAASIAAEVSRAISELLLDLKRELPL